MIECEGICRIQEEYKRRGLANEDELTFDERRAAIDRCQEECCDCMFFEKNGGLGAT